MISSFKKDTRLCADAGVSHSSNIIHRKLGHWFHHHRDCCDVGDDVDAGAGDDVGAGASDDVDPSVSHFSNISHSSEKWPRRSWSPEPSPYYPPTAHAKSYQVL